MKGIGITVVQIAPGMTGTNIDPWEGAGLAQLQEFVGGYIEAAPADERVTIWVNEEGKLNGLPRNRVAENVWRLFDEYKCLAAGDWLAGNVLITGPADENGRTTDIPEDLIEPIMEAAAQMFPEGRQPEDAP